MQNVFKRKLRKEPTPSQPYAAFDSASVLKPDIMNEKDVKLVESKLDKTVLDCLKDACGPKRMLTRITTELILP
jgi:hypothetical protein